MPNRDELDVLREIEKLVRADGVYACDELHEPTPGVSELLAELDEIRTAGVVVKRECGGPAVVTAR